MTWLSAFCRQREEKQLSKLEPYRLYKLGSLQVTKDIPLFLPYSMNCYVSEGWQYWRAPWQSWKPQTLLISPWGQVPHQRFYKLGCFSLVGMASPPIRTHILPGETQLCLSQQRVTSVSWASEVWCSKDWEASLSQPGSRSLQEEHAPRNTNATLGWAVVTRC